MHCDIHIDTSLVSVRKTDNEHRTFDEGFPSPFLEFQSQFAREHTL
jgi:hypothetical protein